MRRWVLLFLCGSAIGSRADYTNRVVGPPAVTTTWATMVAAGADAKAAAPARTLSVPLLSGPGDLPVPGKAASAAAALAPAGQPAPATPAVSAGFLAVPDNNTFIPPDTHGAAGTNYLMVTLNGSVRIQDRAGATISSTTLDAFWTGLGASGTFDPKVIYDPIAHRFIVVSCSDRQSAGSSMLLAISASGDPRGSWYKYRLDGDAGNVNWVDFPELGANTNWATFTANMYSISGNTFAGVNIWAVDKSSVLEGGSIVYTLFYETGSGFCVTPALTYSPSERTQHMANVWSSSGFLRLHRITGTAAAPVYTLTSLLPSSSAWSTVPAAPQLGDSRTIDSGDTRMMNAVLRNGRLWCAHTVGLSSPSRAGAKWWEVDPLTGSTVQSGVVQDPGGLMFYYYPSVAVNQNGQVLLGFSGSSTGSYAGAYYAYRVPADAPGTMEEVRLLKAGENPYYKVYSGTRNRWGDYSATMVDPVDDRAFWTIQEYAASPANQWGTWWGYVFPGDQTQTLWVVSAYGQAEPPAGLTSIVQGTAMACFVTNSPVALSSPTNWLSCLCTGWTGNGSVPASGSTTNTGTFILTMNSTVVWNWVVTDLVVSNQVVLSAATNQARDTVTARDGFQAQSPGHVTLRAGKWVRLGPGFQAATGSALRVRVP